MDRRDFLAGAAALALAPRELLAAAPPRRIALATADLEAHVVAVDLATGAVVERIHTHAYPRSIETVGACAVVCHSELGIVSVLDARSLHVVHVLRGLSFRILGRSVSTATAAPSIATNVRRVGGRQGDFFCSDTVIVASARSARRGRLRPSAA